MSERALKPCPFCGGEATILIGSPDPPYNEAKVECQECGAEAGFTFQRKAEATVVHMATNAWNRRAPAGESVDKPWCERVARIIHEADCADEINETWDDISDEVKGGYLHYAHRIASLNPAGVEGWAGFATEGPYRTFDVIQHDGWVRAVLTFIDSEDEDDG